MTYSLGTYDIFGVERMYFRTSTQLSHKAKEENLRKPLHPTN